jgi:hypothetical protein
MLGGLSRIPYLYYVIKTNNMKSNNTVKENVEFLKGLSGEEFFFRGQYPQYMEEKSDKEWVEYMNKKHGLKWTGKEDKK